MKWDIFERTSQRKIEELEDNNRFSKTEKEKLQNRIEELENELFEESCKVEKLVKILKKKNRIIKKMEQDKKLNEIGKGKLNNVN